MIPQVIVEEYQQEFSCMTLEEVRWLLHKLPRHGSYYTYFLLRLTCGIRGGELLDVQLSQFREGFSKLIYRVDKPKFRPNRHGETVQWTKVRSVKLDPWVRSELLQYLERYMVVQTLPDGTHTYLSSYNRVCADKDGLRKVTQGLLFPWKDLQVILAYWHKLRKAALRAGFDSERVERVYQRTNVNARIMNDKTYVWRPHILRHFSATVMSWKLGGGNAPDHKAVQKWIDHTKADTTWHYVHAASELGTTGEYLYKASWATILGFDALQELLSVRVAEQMVLDCFGD